MDCVHTFWSMLSTHSKHHSTSITMADQEKMKKNDKAAVLHPVPTHQDLIAVREFWCVVRTGPCLLCASIVLRHVIIFERRINCRWAQSHRQREDR
jgi:hypothetical protein